MSKFWSLYKKVGGNNILRQYKKARVLHFALAELSLLGFSRKALEILRLAVQYKIQRKLKKKYLYVLNNLESNEIKDSPHNDSNIVWICWLQGMGDAPLLVQRCFQSIKENLSDKKIIVITSENFKDYVSFPNYILEKWNGGIITNTHFSDLLRLELLIKYGGLWLDATVLCTSNKFPKTMFDSDLFLYQTLKPGADGQSLPISSWLIYARSNNLLLIATKELLYEYWKKNKVMVEYFLIHTFFNIACEYFLDEWNSIPKFCNSNPHVLLLEMFQPFNQDRYEDIKNMSCFHKLSYKCSEEFFNKHETYYDVVIRQGKY